MAERKVWRRRRVQERAAVRLWVCLRGGNRDIECQTLDVSRTGARLRVRLEDVGLTRDSGTFDISRMVTTTLGQGCTAELRHPRASQGILKALGLVRIGMVRRQAGDFEVGCRFADPLAPQELAALGLTLPEDERRVG